MRISREARGRRREDELQLQESAATLFSAGIVLPGWRFVAVRNEATHVGDRRRGARLGIMPGFPDALLLSAGGREGFALARGVEFKSPIGKVSRVQSDAHRELLRLGMRCHIVRSLDEFGGLLVALGAIPLGKRGIPREWNKAAEIFGEGAMA